MLKADEAHIAMKETPKLSEVINGQSIACKYREPVQTIGNPNSQFRYDRDVIFIN